MQVKKSLPERSAKMEFSSQLSNIIWLQVQLKAMA